VLRGKGLSHILRIWVSLSCVRFVKSYLSVSLSLALSCTSWMRQRMKQLRVSVTITWWTRFKLTSSCTEVKLKRLEQCDYMYMYLILYTHISLCGARLSAVFNASREASVEWGPTSCIILYAHTSPLPAFWTPTYTYPLLLLVLALELEVWLGRLLQLRWVKMSWDEVKQRGATRNQQKPKKKTTKKWIIKCADSFVSWTRAGTVAIANMLLVVY